MTTGSPEVVASADLLDLLARWMPQQRWYPAKGRGVSQHHVGGRRLPSPDRTVGIEAHVVALDSGNRTDVVQVPLTYRAAPLPDAASALVGRLRTRGGNRWVYDGPHDPAYVDALLGALGLDGGRRSRVLAGEQSNTSVVVGDDGPDPLIVKVFRTLHDGGNPEVEVLGALARLHCLRVPRVAGALTGSWTASDGGTATGHLAVAAEFLAGAEDAWREAVVAVARRHDFSAQARELGAATAAVHAALRSAFGTDATDDPGRAAIVAGLRARVAWARASAPDALGPFRAGLDAHVVALDELRDLPDLQRVHGDLHLGQVLHAPGRGWVLLDFEGEPLRPLHERTAPDLALRDVAGVLRSFDYAARHVTVGRDASDEQTAAAWAASARDAFCDGYATEAGRDPREDGVLLAALELDKSLYEVVYESRNRPTWLPVPLDAVARLVGTGSTATVETIARTPEEDPVPTPAAPTGPAVRPVDRVVLHRVAFGASATPHDVLGPHAHDGGVTVRALRPLAESVTVVLGDGSRTALRHESEGVWVGVLDADDVPDYRLEVAYPGHDPVVQDDPYRFLPTLGEIDQHLITEGRHEQLWDVLGAHVRRYPGGIADVVGTSFAVWAPRAQAVRLISDVNHWDGRMHAMRSLGSTGVWELFVPDVGAGTHYKFEILGRDGHWRQKADPMASGAEVPPLTASLVVESAYSWGDDAWLAARADSDPHDAPMSVYEVHLGSWRQGLGYRELATQLVEYVRDNGFTHVELLPVMEHPFGGSWGYHVTGYFAPTSRLGHPDDFRYLVDQLHQAGVGVILDWVPGHFATDPWALVAFDGEPLYEYSDPRRGWHAEWGSYIFDVGRREVRNFLVANALYWLEEFHADGLRVDGVASMLYLDYSRDEGEWTPNRYGGRENLEAVEFLQEVNATAYKRVPGVVVVAEESTAWPGVTRPTHLGGLGFGMKWNMGWMHDSLGYVAEDPVHRQYHHHRMTFSLMYAFSENFVLPISHDEVVHGKGSLLRKMPGDRWQQLANLRAFLAYMWAHPGKQLVFMGSEFGQEAEWAESRSLDWWLLDQPVHAGVLAMVRDLNRLYTGTRALWELDSDASGFEWIDANDTLHNVFSFVRRDKAGEPLACLVNFAGTPHEGYRVGLPRAGDWDEVLNTDGEGYGGSGVGNLGKIVAEPVPHHGMPASAVLRLPPLGALWLTPSTGPAEPARGR